MSCKKANANPLRIDEDDEEQTIDAIQGNDESSAPTTKRTNTDAQQMKPQMETHDKLDGLMAWTHKSKGATYFQLPSSNFATVGPPEETIRYRTTVNLDTGDIYEYQQPIQGLLSAIRWQKLPIKNGAKTANIRTTYFYEPGGVEGKWIDGRWVRKIHSTNPGVWPEIWAKYSATKRDEVIKEFKRRKQGFYNGKDYKCVTYATVKRAQPANEVAAAAISTPVFGRYKFPRLKTIKPDQQAPAEHRVKCEQRHTTYYNPMTDTCYEVQADWTAANTKKEPIHHLQPFNEIITPESHNINADSTSEPAMVAREVGKKEYNESAKAQAALKKEIDRLANINTWIEDEVQPLHAVKKAADRQGIKIHIGRVLWIMVEKNSELSPDNPLRKMKGRVVFQGNQVRDQFGEVAFFQELGASPAPMNASKVTDIHGFFYDYVVQQADAPQAYTQTELKGHPTWVRLPKEMWPKNDDGTYKWDNIRDPVVPLRLALYGHPDAGGYWEKHYEEHLQALQWEQIPGWKSCFRHPIHKTILTVYVDDFRMSGPAEACKQAWKEIQNDSTTGTKGIILDEVETVDAKGSRYLGCEPKTYTKTITWQGDAMPPPPPKPPKKIKDPDAPDPVRTVSMADELRKEYRPTTRKRTVRIMEYDNGEFMKACVERYCELTGYKRKDLLKASTPLLEDTAHDFGIGTTTEQHFEGGFSEESAMANIRHVLKEAPIHPRGPQNKTKMTWPIIEPEQEPAGGAAAQRLQIRMEDYNSPWQDNISVSNETPQEFPATESEPENEDSFEFCAAAPQAQSAGKHKKKVITSTKPDTEEPPGILAGIAVCVIMKILYGARMARYDLLRPVQYLASSVTKWTPQCDRDLHRLICYINSTLDYRQISWIGDNFEDVNLMFYADADMAGCTRTQRSTSGVVSMITGPNSKALIGAVSKRQTAISASTSEAEFAAAALRIEVIPLLDFVTFAWREHTNIVALFGEDNEALMRIIKSGNWQKFRHLGRTHRINVAQIIEIVQTNDHIVVQPTASQDQAADIYTKRFTDPYKWHSLLYLNNCISPAF